VEVEKSAEAAAQEGSARWDHGFHGSQAEWVKGERGGSRSLLPGEQIRPIEDYGELAVRPAAFLRGE